MFIKLRITRGQKEKHLKMMKVKGSRLSSLK